MARDHGRVLCSVWRDPTFIALPARAQRMYMLLLSQPRLTLCGTLDFTPARWATLSGDGTEADVRGALDELEAEHFVIIDEAAEEVLIRSFVRHDGILDSPNLIQGMWKAWVGVHSSILRAAVILELPEKAFEPGFGTAKKDYMPPAEALGLRRGDGSLNPSSNPSGNPSPTPVPVPVPVPGAKTNVEPELVLVEVSPAATSDVQVVFDAWIAATGRTGQTQLDKKRRRLIGEALRAYPLEDVVDAVRGWRNSPFHCGQNDRGRAYNDLGLLLRDADHIEAFRDLERQPAGAPVPKRYQALLAWADQKETA